MEKHTDDVAAHYRCDDLIDSILDALRKDGRDLDALTIDDLQMVDEVHTRGRETTKEVAALTDFTPSDDVIDVGSGLGGPARYVARTFGCRVTGIDLTPGFVEAAKRLTELTGLTDRVSFRQGSALDLPFADESFDIAWTIQMQMNIADKPRLYREIRRVLKPGGRLVFQDIVAGRVAGIHTPVPWASDPTHSHLVTADELKAAIEGAGFEAIHWRDTTPEQVARRARGSGRKPKGPFPATGIHLVLGDNFREKRRNGDRNLAEERIGYLQAVLARS